MFINLKDYKIENSKLSSYIPWFALVAPGVILTLTAAFKKHSDTAAVT